MAGIIHKYQGDWDKVFKWEDSRSRLYQNQVTNQVSETWMIGKKEGARNFAFRYYQIEAGGHSRKEQHAHDHGIMILQGSGKVLLGDEKFSISRGDVIYIPPDEIHQITNPTDEPLGFLCVIPASREKAGKSVWAEEGIDFNDE